MRFLLIVILLIFAALGIVVGALNAQIVAIDLAALQVHLPLGASLLSVLAVGWITGGLTAWVGVRSGRQRRRQPKSVAVPADA